ESVRTNPARFVQAAAGNFGSGIGVGIFKRGVDHFRNQELVKRAEAPPRENQIPTSLKIATAHEAKQFDLLLDMKRKIGMAPFGKHNAITARIPKQNELTQPRASSQQDAYAPELELARI